MRLGALTKVLAATGLLATTALATTALAAPPGPLAGYTVSPHFGEQIRDFTFDPDVLVHVNAPAPDQFDPALPVRLVVFALPNGNTIAQTIGCKLTDGIDWHFDIQHIGAQARLVRSRLTGANLVVAYVQARHLSWPGWRRQHEQSGAAIVRLVETLRAEFPADSTTVELVAHSGGGSLLFGLIEQVPQIPTWITRFAWLDANYSFDGQKHAGKLADWLRSDAHHVLSAICYDDRNVTLNGKPIVSSTGGTYRRTEEMVSVFQDPFQLAADATDAFRRYRDAAGRIEFILLHNPENAILHTVMVERNGFIHAVTLGTPLAGRVAEFWADRAYSDLIQPADAPPLSKSQSATAP